LGKIGLENGKLYKQMKKDNKILKKNQQQAYKLLLKEVQTAEKEYVKVKNEARKAITMILKKHTKIAKKEAAAKEARYAKMEAKEEVLSN
jgi:hypothetical protein